MGKNRLRTLTDQLATMFTQSTQAVNTSILAETKQDVLKKFIRSGGNQFRNEALAIVNKVKKDSTWLLIAVLDSVKAPVLIEGYSGVKNKLSLDTIF